MLLHFASVVHFAAIITHNVHTYQCSLQGGKETTRGTCLGSLPFQHKQLRQHHWWMLSTDNADITCALISVEIRLIRLMMNAMIVSNKWNLINGSNVYLESIKKENVDLKNGSARRTESLSCVINCLMWLSQESKVTATTSLQWRIGGFQSVVRYSKWTPKGIYEKKDRFLTPCSFSQFLKCYCFCQLS